MIKLTQKEQLLFDLLKKCLKFQNLDLTLRVAGGWVRDKLLDKQSSDIDITLDKMMGRNFVLCLQEYLNSQNIESHKMGIIKKNPEQSKHLEAATIQILDYEVDFVNLRGEEYVEDSRIPLQKMGTPLEDAFRRDFTINALFYNINEDKVEDYTNKGLEDLQKKILRTPLCPIKTFIDDPLRILRGFRFAARYQFQLEQNAYQYIKQDQDIKIHFSNKISKERIGFEFIYNFNFQISQRPLDFLFYLHDTNILPYIFQNQDQETISKIETGYKMLEQFVSLNQNIDNVNYFIKNEKQYQTNEVLMIIYISLLTQQFFSLEVKKQDYKNYYGYKFCQKQLKFSNKLSELCSRIQSGLYTLNQLGLNAPIEQLAMWQRQQKSLYKIIDEIYIKLYTTHQYKDNNIQKILKQNNLEEFYKQKPILNGKEVIQNFNVKGKEVAIKIEEILKWQALNPFKKKEEFLNKKQFFV